MHHGCMNNKYKEIFGEHVKDMEKIVIDIAD
jgi:hypothetical protein